MLYDKAALSPVIELRILDLKNLTNLNKKFRE